MVETAKILYGAIRHRGSPKKGIITVVLNYTPRPGTELKLGGLTSILLLLGIVVLLSVNVSMIPARQLTGTTLGAPALGTGTPTATATPTPDAVPTVCPIQFSDVPYDVPFYGPILCLACQEVLNGYSDGTFRSESTATRGQLVKLIANALGYDDAIPQDRQTFMDVPTAFPFWLYIERAALHGVISGYDDGTFRPNADVTRGQAVKILDNAARYVDSIPQDRQTFTDVPNTAPVWLYIERAAVHGIISGYTCGAPPAGPCDDHNRPYFLAEHAISRGQAAKIVVTSFFPSCPVPPPTYQTLVGGTQFPYDGDPVTIYARLTYGGRPVPGARLSLYDGPACAITDATGWAGCTIIAYGECFTSFVVPVTVTAPDGYVIATSVRIYMESCP